MGLGVPEIRARAERLKAELARERYETKAGLKERPAFTEIYGAQDLLLSEEAVPAIQRELAEATGEGQRRLRYLLAWVAEQRVEAAVAPLEDELRGWEASATVRFGGRELRFRGAGRAIEKEPNRGARVALERTRSERLEEALPLQVDLLHRERGAVAALGLGGYVEARERLSCLNVRGLERQARRILEETEDAYRELLAHAARRRLDVDPEQATRSDVAWLRRMPWLDGSFALSDVLDTLRANLVSLGLPLEADGRVRLDLEERPLKGPRAFSAPVRVPDDVILVAPSAGGWPDCRALLHEAGHVLHFAYTEPGLPFEFRALGDSAVTEAYALLFESLTLEPAWLRLSVGLEGGRLEEYRRFAAFLALHGLRRQAAKLLYELELWESERPSEMGPRYAEIFGHALGVTHDPRTYLEEPDRGFWVARQLRAWMLWAILRAVLRERYDEDWFRNPAAGPFLGELFAGGQREDAARLAGELGAEGLRVGPVVEGFGERLA